MRLVNYADAARRIAIYPMKMFITYPTLGLVGEMTEFIDKILNDAPKAEICKEIGDILWYLANLAIDCGIQMHTIIPGCTTFGDIEAEMLSDPNPIKLIYPVGAICELVKKLHRDDGGKLSPERRERVRQNLAVIFLGLTAITQFWGWSLGEIARENLAKLNSRQQRGTLTGDGDNR